MKIITPIIGGKGDCLETTAYKAVLLITEKATRHYAVEVGGKRAREAQRNFASWVNRLAKLLSKKFPDAALEIRWLDASPCCKAIRQDNTTLAVHCLVIRNNKIQRAFAAVHSFGGYSQVVAETTEYAHPHADWLSGKTTLVSVYPAERTVKARNAIVATQFVTVAPEQAAA